MRVRSAFRLSAIIIGIWLLWAIFKASEHYRRAAATIQMDEFVAILSFQLSAALLWAFSTPIIMALSQRLSFRGAPVRDAVLFVLGVPAVAIIRAVFGAMIFELHENGYITLEFIKLCIRIRLFQNVLFVVAIFVITRVIVAMREGAERQQRVAAIERHLAERKLEELRARFPRSFLFGTLQTIRDLIRRDTRAADDLIVAFGNVLRLAADTAHVPRIPLEDELYFIDQYLRVRMLTTGRTIDFHFEADDDALAMTVRPMSLQPLVEEAIERGGDPLPLTIRGRAVDGELSLTVDAGVRAEPIAAEVLGVSA